MLRPRMDAGLRAELKEFAEVGPPPQFRAHRSLIWFTVASSVVHAGIMAAQAIAEPEERGHLLGDVPALLIVAVVLGALMWRAEESRRART